MALRPASPSDAEAVSRLLNMSDCAAALIDDGRLRVLTQDSYVVGVMMMSDGIDHLVIDHIAIVQSSKADAFAKIMVMFAEQEARERGHDQVRLEVPDPVTLYRSLGYRHSGRIEKDGVSLSLMTKIVV